MELLFVYGTLREKTVEREATGHTFEGIPDILEGYNKKYVHLHGEPYPIIHRLDNSFVHGLILNVTKKDLAKIDKYEDKIYERVLVVLKSGKKAWVYRERELVIHK
ncbi:MAG TPA: gamma-glutamylcyclotransferase family protein [Candidatus Nanoarchaeia archaeon]|nr:gamma-glutamylcyclotransferase family protein [Candidatus Nanoarchaeia archaeon]